jgi:DNA-binding transcriptional ArsR family regulator
MTSPVPPSYLRAAAARFRLLGDPVRLQILNTLLERNEAAVQELAEATGQSHQNTSKHLRALADGGIVGARREGGFAYYRVTDPSISGLCLLVCGQLQRMALDETT